MCLPVKPFKIEKEWIAFGLTCAVVEARENRHRCGYVRVNSLHPMYNKSYDEPVVDVHGGLTFAMLETSSEEDGIGYWFGFDCCHCDDAMFKPGFEPAGYPAILKGHYWTYDEVVRETLHLAKQLAEYGVGNVGA